MMLPTQKVRFQYTPEAKKLLPSYNQLQTKRLESRVARDKYVFGDELVEITASDIQNAIEHLSSERTSLFTYSSMYKFIAGIYGGGGLFILLYGLFFEQIRALLYSQPQRVILIALGTLMIVASLLLSFWLKMRDRMNRNKLEQYYMLHQAESEGMENHYRKYLS